MNIPKDPVILMSFLNTKLRDFYPSLDALCSDLELDKEEILKKLSAFGFEYKSESNKFIWQNLIFFWIFLKN